MPAGVALFLAHLFVLATCAPLVGAFVIQFACGELPCPLCMLQRTGLLLAGLGPLSIIYRARRGGADATAVATGYGLSVLAAVGTQAIATRQVLLHQAPGDLGYGSPVLGMHPYTWMVVITVVIALCAAAQLIFMPRGVLTIARPSRLGRMVVGLFLALIVANIVAMLVESGFHWSLPEDPVRYQLIDDLTPTLGSDALRVPAQ